MDHYHGSQGLKLKVTGQGQDTVGLTSISRYVLEMVKDSLVMM